jgi:hypothetical protein
VGKCVFASNFSAIKLLSIHGGNGSRALGRVLESDKSKPTMAVRASTRRHNVRLQTTAKGRKSIEERCVADIP